MRSHFTLLLLSLGLVGKAQVACDILAPVDMQASYAHTWAEPAAGSWATPDMLLEANRVVAEVALAYDGTAADSLCCATIANAAAITGKIAVLYRGTCDYSEKAKFCQDAGAVAVVIINNLPGDPVNMGAGAIGQQVTIPVFQIGQDDGAVLRAALDGGTTISMLLGNKAGYYASDVGFNMMGILLPPSLAIPRLLAANASEYVVQVGAWVHNFGSEDRTDVTISAEVMHNASSVYDESSAPFDLIAGDSIFVTLPDFTQNTYAGRYTLTYSTASTDPDEHELDNTFAVPFEFNDSYSFAPIEATTGIPVTTIGLQPAAPAGEHGSCVHFRNAHASRVAMTGVDRYVSIADPATLNSELVFTRVYQWMDNFTGLSDTNFGFTVLGEVHYQKHILDATTDQARIFLPFADPVMLDDNVRYLVCTSTFNADVFFGYNEKVHYATHEEVYDQPTCPNHNGSNWFVGFVGGPVVSMGVKMIDANTIGMDEHSNNTLAPYPNPSKGVFQIALSQAGPATLEVADATGRVVSTQRITGGSHTLDLSGEAPGVYTLTVHNATGRAVGRLIVE